MTNPEMFLLVFGAYVLLLGIAVLISHIKKP